MLELHYDVVGAGPSVLLIQGVGIAGCAWRPQIEALRGRFRVAAFDNRGIGKSAAHRGALSIEAMADDALAVMDAIGFDRAHVVGHSMGGVIAQELALRVPDRVRTLSLLCTFVRGKDAVALSPWLVWIALRGKIGTRRMRNLAFLEMVSPRSILAGDRDAAAAMLGDAFGRDLCDPPSIAMTQLRAMAKYDASARLPSIAHIPTLVVSATEDRVAPPRSGRELARAIGGHYEEIEGASHACTIQHADAINDLLAAHFDRG